MGFKYDQTDIHLRYKKSRRLPEETIALWLESISRYVPRDSTRIVVDLGCGTGRFTEGLSAHFSARVYGIDSSWKMLTQALKSTRMPGSDQRGSRNFASGIARKAMVSPTIGFIYGSAECIPLASEVADLVFLSMVYHHIQDKDKAACEFKRVLKTGGFLCIRTSTTDSLDAYPYLQFFPKARQINLSNLPSRRDITDFLQDNGFEMVGHNIVRQITAENHHEYYEKIRLRGLSDLAAIADEEFYEGLTRFWEYCCEQNTDEAVFEDIDLFAFRV